MANFAIFALLVGAGAAIVAQNILMAKISGNATTILVPLIMNSAVGLAVLTLLLIWRTGAAGVSEILHLFRPWNIFPGLLGSFFVFASILGYQRIGAAATVAVLVASQLGFGLLTDVFRSGNIAGITLFGAALLLAGAGLVAFRAV
ncbi:DMT family transporter [Rhizobium rhizogenes]|uniref:DMT family transporter n=1 Tax=Rhizobium rhizogenes TaxID=359 RepID=UPI0022BDEC1E|nr:DMT family transporter [Rhizobium rhizogenes]MCZ7466394.1 DMT family transporter [Rhizobium rhizogenes]